MKLSISGLAFGLFYLVVGLTDTEGSGYTGPGLLRLVMSMPWESWFSGWLGYDLASNLGFGINVVLAYCLGSFASWLVRRVYEAWQLQNEDSR